jgi:class 3 adenylate cyclase
MEFRMGVNLGDAMVEGDQIHGDGVNSTDRESGRTGRHLYLPDGARKHLLLNGTVAPRRTQQVERKFRRVGAASFAGLTIVIATIVLVQQQN